MNAIERRRIALRIPTLVELTRLAQKRDEVPDNASTWLSWKGGVSSPKFVDLDDFARAVGLQLDITDGAGAPAALSEEAAEVAEYVNAIEDAELRAKIRDAVQRLIPVIEAGHRSAKAK